VIVVAAATATGGAILGIDRARDQSQAPVTPPRPARVSGGGLSLAYLPEWQLVRGRPPEDLAIAFRHPLVLRHGTSSWTIAAEVLPVTGAGLLPAGFVRERAQGPMVRGESPDGRITIYVTVTTAGAATVACRGVGAGTDCLGAAGSLAVPGAETLPPSRRATFRAALPSVVRELDTRRRAGRSALAQATSTSARAAAARALAEAHARASRTLATFRPRNPLVLALSGTAAAYADLARAGDAPAFLAARRDVVDAEAALAHALGRARRA
jgi:hypothetical protein